MQSPRHNVILTDSVARSRDVAALLGRVGRCQIVTTDAAGSGISPSASAVVVDVDLCEADTVRKVRSRLAAKGVRNIPRLFVIDGESHRDMTQARALNASGFIARPVKPDKMVALIGQLAEERFAVEAGGLEKPMQDGVLAASNSLKRLLDAARSGQPVLDPQLEESEDNIMAALAAGGLDRWIDAVRLHHSFTYRHCLLVAGVASAFSQQLGMRRSDERRLVRAALLHDIGKAFIPVEILDKPSQLTTAEMQVMRTHPVEGFRLLKQQGGVSSEVLDVVLHHHELLDGTGYPDGLKGRQINDVVHLITISDIYSALIEPRVYKPALPAERAFAIMTDMAGKLDPALLNSFRSVALGLEHKA
jgi:putative nucleotidyltransferase with HDIG domain